MPGVLSQAARSDVSLIMLGTPCVVRSSDPEVLDWCHAKYAHFLGEANEIDPPARTFELVPAPPSELAELRLDGVVVRTAEDLRGLLVPLGNELNRLAVAGSTHLTVHAAAVSRGGRAVLLPAEMESGKTTLTVALIRAGFDYITDEAVALDRVDGSIHPYAKPLFLDPGSWPLFADLAPRSDPTREPEQWHIGPDEIRAGCVASGATPAWIVFPTYRAGSASSLCPISRAEALLEMTKNTFAFSARSRANLDQLADVVRSCRCYRLRVDDLDEAVRILSGLVEKGLPS